MQPSSLILCPDLLIHLSPTLFTLPALAPALSPLSLPLEALLQTMWPAWFTECLGYCRLLVTVDSTNRTGIRDRGFVDKLTDDWLTPLRNRLDILKLDMQCGHAGVEAEFVLERWDDALSRAAEAVWRR